MDQADTARGTVERFLHAIVSEHPEDMADCYADDAVLEMPFAVELLYPARIHTTGNSCARGSRPGRPSGGTRAWTRSRSTRPRTPRWSWRSSR